MAKVTYANLKLKLQENVRTFTVEDKEIEVKQYLSISDKIDLIDITMQKSKEDKIYNPVKLDMYFHLHLVYLYTNITFTEKQREDEYKLYDILSTNDIINKVIENIPEIEYESLFDLMEDKIEVEMNYKTTAAAMIENLLEQLPRSANTAADIMNSIDTSSMDNVIAFAKAINADRDI